MGDLGGRAGGRPQARDPGGTAGEQGGTNLRAQGADRLSPQSKVHRRSWAGQAAVSCSPRSPCLPRLPPSTEALRAPHAEVGPEPPGLSLVGARLRGAVLSSAQGGGGLGGPGVRLPPEATHCSCHPPGSPADSDPAQALHHLLGLCLTPPHAPRPHPSSLPFTKSPWARVSPLSPTLPSAQL